MVNDTLPALTAKANQLSVNMNSSASGTANSKAGADKPNSFFHGSSDSKLSNKADMSNPINDARQTTPTNQNGGSLRKPINCSTAVAEDSAKRQPLYPFIVPYYDSLLRVSPIHQVYYEISGNPKGIPVCFVHGGPGGGTEPAHRQFFNPMMYKIVLIDQRGCGSSRPFASLQDNTTWDLIEDMDAVRQAAGIERWILFGGSWGSTLSLAYAQEHPDRVIGMILRGIFLSRDEELRWLYEREGIAMLYPEAFERYLSGLPPHLRDSESLVQAYHSILSREESSEERRVAANAWSQWEYSLSSFPRPNKNGSNCHIVSRNSSKHQVNRNSNDCVSSSNSFELVPNLLEYSDNDNLAFARIESHFFVNGCFFNSSGMLLNEDRMARVKHIKTRIVQGRWDFVCPRKTAFDLAKMFDPSAVETHIIDSAGHSTFEPGIEEALLRATGDFASEFVHLANGTGADPARGG